MFCFANPVNFLDPWGLRTLQLEGGIQGTVGMILFVHGELNFGLDVNLDSPLSVILDSRYYIRAQGAGMFGWLGGAQVGPQLLIGTAANPVPAGLDFYDSVHAEGGWGWGPFGGASADLYHDGPCESVADFFSGLGGSGAVSIFGGAGGGFYFAEGPARNVTYGAPSLRERLIEVRRIFRRIFRR